MIGRVVEIIVLDETSAPPAAQAGKPVESIEERSHPDLADAFDGFEEALEQWRKEPWRSGDEIDLGKDE